MTQDEALQQAADFLDQRFGLETLWLFGSEAQGTSRPDSDLDLGALLTRRPSTLERLDAQTELAEVVRRPVDLVDLDAASPILGMQVLKHGRLLTDRNPQRRYASFSRTLSMYEDLKILRREAERSLLERFRRGASRDRS